MQKPQPIILAEGSAEFQLVVSEQWPSLRPTYSTHKLDEGVLIVGVTVDGRFTASIGKSKDLPIYSVATGQFRIVHFGFVFFAVTWEIPGFLKIYINGELAACSDDFSLYFKYRAITVRQTPGIQGVDYSLKNDGALKIRKKEFDLLQARKANDFAGLSYLKSALADEIKQIEDLLLLIRSGNMAHIRGLSSRLRLLLSRKRQSPLLQTIAGALNAALIIYAVPDPEQAPGLSDKPSYLVTHYPIRGAKTERTPNPVDIDVWLSFVGMYVGDIALTNDKLITDIGNTVGSHLDPKIVASVSILKSQSHLGSLDGSQDFFNNFLLELGEVVVVLGRQPSALFSK